MGKTRVLMPLVLPAPGLTGDDGVGDNKYWQYSLFGDAMTQLNDGEAYRIYSSCPAVLHLASPDEVIDFALRCLDLDGVSHLYQQYLYRLNVGVRMIERACVVARIDVLGWMWQERAQIDLQRDHLTRELSRMCEKSPNLAGMYLDRMAVMEWLLEAGAHPDGLMVGTTYRSYRPPLSFTAATGRLEEMRLLLSKGAGVDGWDSDAPSPVVMAAHVPEAMEVLAEHGANFDRDRVAAQAALDESGASLRLIMRHGCPKERLDEAMLETVRSGKQFGTNHVSERLARLVRAGASPSGVPNLPDTPLGLAVRRREWRTVMAILSLGADPDGGVSGDDRPVCQALRGASENTTVAAALVALLKAGAELPARLDGRTPLQWLSRAPAELKDEVKRIIRSRAMERSLQQAMADQSDPEGPVDLPRPASRGISPL